MNTPSLLDLEDLVPQETEPFMKDKCSIRFNRRQILKAAGYGSLGLMAGKFWPFYDLSAGSQKDPVTQEKEFMPDLGRIGCSPDKYAAHLTGGHKHWTKGGDFQRSHN